VESVILPTALGKLQEEEHLWSRFGIRYNLTSRLFLVFNIHNGGPR
jgi:hypothetical protein